MTFYKNERELASKVESAAENPEAKENSSRMGLELKRIWLTVGMVTPAIPKTGCAATGAL